MRVAVATAPTAPLLTVEAVRGQLGLGPDVPDARITALVAAATSVLEGPQGWLGRALRPWTLELRLDRFPVGEGAVELPFPPITAAKTIRYVDAGGVTQTLDAALWQSDGDCTLYPAFGHAWPVGRSGPNAVRVEYDCGYPDEGAVPAPILQAIVLQVAATNAMLRADPGLSSETVPGVLSRSWSTTDIGDIYDKAAMRLLGPYRVFR